MNNPFLLYCYFTVFRRLNSQSPPHHLLLTYYSLTTHLLLTYYPHPTLPPPSLLPHSSLLPMAAPYGCPQWLLSRKKKLQKQEKCCIFANINL